MYFYRILASDYESHRETTFVSDIKYTKEELEDIVVDAYKASCERYMDEDINNVCFALSFCPEDRIFDYHKFTEQYLEKQYHLVPLNQYTAQVFIDSTFDGRSKELDKKMKQALDSLYVDESCWDNDCSRLPDEKERPSWYRDNCIVYKRKAQRVNRSCDNCISHMEYESCKKKANPCEGWVWDGDKTLKEY